MNQGAETEYRPSVKPEAAEDPLILSLDIGTSSVRAALFDGIGRPVTGVLSRQEHKLHTAPDGTSEANPDALLETLWHCVDGVTAAAGPLNPRIAAVATCTFVTNIMALDRASRALTSLTTYADTRSQSEVAGLRKEMDESAFHERTGCHFHSSYLPARFRWLFRSQPEAFRRVSRWISFGEYMELKLFGDTAVTYSVASWTGLLNRHVLNWDEELLETLPVRREQLSPLTDLNVPRQGLQPEYAARWPALSNVPWFPAVGDGVSANIGSGCVSPNRIALTIGTTSALRAVVDATVHSIPAGLWCYRVDKVRSLPGGAMSEGGSLFAWMRETLQLGDLSKLEQKLSAMEPDAHGLTVLPFLAGERAPGWAGDARAIIRGLSTATSPLDILRASLEAVAYRIALVFGLLCQLLPDDPQVVASGGAILSSPAWLQIMADVLGRPVAVSEIQEASARGSALLAIESLGMVTDLKQLPDHISRVYHPERKRHDRYMQALQRQRALYDQIIKEKGGM